MNVCRVHMSVQVAHERDFGLNSRGQCVCTYVRMYVCMCVCKQVWLTVMMNACRLQMSVISGSISGVDVCMYICTYVCMYLCMYVCMRVCVCVYVSMMYSNDECVQLHMSTNSESISARYDFITYYTWSNKLYFFIHIILLLITRKSKRVQTYTYKFTHVKRKKNTIATYFSEIVVR